MRCDSRGSIIFEDVLDRPGRNIFSLLAYEDRADDSDTDELQDICQGLIVNKDGAYLIALSPDPDGMLIKIDVFHIHVTELRYPDTCGVDGPDNELVTQILDGIQQPQHLVVLEVFHLLLFYPGAIDAGQGIGGDGTLGIEETVKGVRVEMIR